MARKIILVSDLTGEAIEDKKAAKVTISYSDARKGQVVLDVNEDESSRSCTPGSRPARGRSGRLGVGA